MANFLEEVKIQDYVSSGLTYYGYAWPGTSTSVRMWKVSRKVHTTANSYKLEYALPPSATSTVNPVPLPPVVGKLLPTLPAPQP